MVNISADTAIALGMIPECLLPTSDSLPDFRDEYGSGWFWFVEKYEEPRRIAVDVPVCVVRVRRIWK